ncbi:MULTISPECIES: Asp23/Gls24 family envelope stress response protein [Gordonia]|uniref:Asp23/Gls24 family envelope stress response protein n=2 Tax=Gordonia TaxID=2053 RepID=L7LN64_9ACTN|nr:MULTISPECIES: Asp23/Gls24 family envelope stress response protein [Gordonia]AUH67588.1 Asp23/Gls24 family envelope stress response protein [Gordonia sp. YC-JH1]KJR07244.1 hypothetical protein UG54_11335 [Gordonia sihwensis]KXT57199.1 hypothetical protein Y710_08800 [Gordonia sp. QH-12]MBY4568691.1 hypothetical protein [Gordonia sihwensis]WFN92747.1 Asp23/Gls24 family envelope stress response protein [Gordonia sihwensis]
MAPPSADDALVKDIAAAVLAVPGVVELDGGMFGEVATYLPGERVSGIRLSDEEGSVHIVVDLRHDLREVAAQVADTASEISGRRFSVTIEDVTTGEPAAAGTATTESEGELDD